MPSEFSPSWTNAKMSKSQIIKVLRERELARKIAEKKIANAKNSEEWKKEEEILAELEKEIDNFSNLA